MYAILVLLDFEKKSKFIIDGLPVILTWLVKNYLGSTDESNAPQELTNMQNKKI